MDQQAEEQAAIDNERRAFERRQTAIAEVIKQSTPQGSGVPTPSALAELDAADADWKRADEEMKRIIGEAHAGGRR